MARGVALVGLGVGMQHLEAFLDLPGLFEVRWICDLDEARAGEALALAPGVRVSTDIAEALNDPDVEIVDICLPPHLHLEACEAVLAAGKHVICEKPLVTSLAHVDRLAEAERDASGTVFPVFQYRYGKAATELSALIESGIAGRPFTATLETHWNRDAEYYAVPWRGTWAGEQGGAILGHAIHLHDWLSFALGPVASVYAAVDTRVNAIETEDCAGLTIRMENGAIVTSSVTLGAADDTSRLRLIFDGLTAESGRDPYRPAEDTWTYCARAPRTQAEVDAVLASVSKPSAGYRGLFRDIDGTLRGDGRAPTLVDARRSIEFVTAVYTSARSGQPVDLPISGDHPLYEGWLPG